MSTTEPGVTLADLDVGAAELVSRVHAVSEKLAKKRAFTLPEIAAALDFAEVPAASANRTLALLSFLARLP